MQSTVESLTQYLANLPADLADSPMAAAAMRLAEGLDNGHNSLTSQSMAAKAFQDLLGELRELAPAKKTEDVVDELSSRRGRRRRGRDAAAQ
jgi:hypothetical protein